LIYLLAAGALLLIYLSVRGRWVLWQIEAYKINALWYLSKTKQSKGVATEMSVIWPLTNILLEPWNWNFSRYIVHQDHLENMNEFMKRELEKPKLSVAASPGNEDDEDDPGDDIDNFSTAKKPATPPKDPSVN
jgi:hypothetical protein